jgi:hypothetical protein
LLELLRFAGRLKLTHQILGCFWALVQLQGALHGLCLLRECFRPGQHFFGGGFGGFCFGAQADVCLLGTLRVLVLGAEPADEATFLGGAFLVQGYEALEYFFLGQVGGPAIGGGFRL